MIINIMQDTVAGEHRIGLVSVLTVPREGEKINIDNGLVVQVLEVRHQAILFRGPGSEYYPEHACATLKVRVV